jgi:hypothetical protein
MECSCTRRASEIGFLISDMLLVRVSTVVTELTSNSTNGTTAAQMVDNGSIALDDAIHSQIATIPGIGDLPVLERFDCSLYSIDSCAAVFHDEHGKLRSAAVRSVVVRHSCA